VGGEVRVWIALTARKPGNLVRRVLAHETGTSSDAISLDTTCRWCGDACHGKPRATSGPPFSFASTAGLAVVAVGPDELGVDVERNTGRGVLEGGRLALAESERSAVRDAPDPATAFLALWTRKEAYLKGIGRGLIDDPAGVTFSPADGTWARVVHAGRPTAWLVRSLDVSAQFVGALAVHGSPTRVRLVTWPPAV
jgi:4'-phosphopantetheinyl transferase